MMQCSGSSNEQKALIYEDYELGEDGFITFVMLSLHKHGRSKGLKINLPDIAFFVNNNYYLSGNAISPRLSRTFKDNSNSKDKQTPVQQAIPIVPEELAAQTPPVTLIEDDVAIVSQASTSNDNHSDSSKIQLNESRTDSDQVSNQYNIAVTNENVKIPILEQKSDIKTNGKQSTNPNNGGVTAPSVQLAAPKSVDKNSGKKDTQPKLIPTGVPLVASKDSNRVNNVQGNSKQPSYPDKNNPAPQNAKSKLPVIAAAMLAITGVATGIAIAVYLEMLAVGIAFGACCLVAATIVYYCNKPSKSLESSNAERVTSAEMAVEK